jgi:hypothetical protein
LSLWSFSFDFGGRHGRALERRPFSLAALVFIVGMLPLLYHAPNIAAGVVSLIGVLPVIRLLKRRLGETQQRMLVALIASVLTWHLVRTRSHACVD